MGFEVEATSGCATGAEDELCDPEGDVTGGDVPVVGGVAIKTVPTEADCSAVQPKVALCVVN